MCAYMNSRPSLSMGSNCRSKIFEKKCICAEYVQTLSLSAFPKQHRITNGARTVLECVHW
jgi:hypothetical protein